MNVDQIFSSFNNHDPAALAQLYAQDATYMLSGEPELLRGRKAIQKSYEVFFRAFPDMSVEKTLSMTSGDHHFAEAIARGTHTGPFATPQGEIAPTGRKIELKMAFVAKVTPEGLIAEDRTYFDSAVMMSQLGLD